MKEWAREEERGSGEEERRGSRGEHGGVHMEGRGTARGPIIALVCVWALSLLLQTIPLVHNHWILFPPPLLLTRPPSSTHYYYYSFSSQISSFNNIQFHLQSFLFIIHLIPFIFSYSPQKNKTKHFIH